MLKILALSCLLRDSAASNGAAPPTGLWRLFLMLAGAEHIFRAYPLVEFFVGQVTQLQRRFAQGQPFGIGFLAICADLS